MLLTDKQQFKVGFLQQCANEGLSVPEIKQRIKTAAAFMHEKKADLGAVLSSLAQLGGGAAVALPIGLGAAGGYGLAKSMNARDADQAENVLQDAKRKELIDEYKRLANAAKRQVRLKQIGTTPM